MKKVLSLILAMVMVFAAVLLAACEGDKEGAETGDANTENDKIIVNTNAYFAPFEYYDGTEIVGVDVDIMNKVGEKLGKTIEFQNTEFAVIIDNVAKGEVCDCGAAGITITEARAEKVDFSTPYYTSVQYVIYAEDDAAFADKADDDHILWDDLADKTVGVQTDTTGMIFAEAELEEGGVLEGTNTEIKNFDNAQLAADAITANQIDYVIIDELPAKFIVDKNEGLKCLPLFYKGAEGEEDAPTEEQYAICVTKGNTELLDAINAVLADMMVEDADGKTEVMKLVMQHMGLN